MTTRRTLAHLLLPTALIALTALQACGSSDDKGPAGLPDDGGGGAGAGGSGGRAGSSAGVAGSSSGAGGSSAGAAGSAGSAGEGGAAGSGPLSCTTNGKKDGSETDVDCGGGCPSRCGVGLACAEAADCDVNSCVQGKCAIATCTDKTQNGSETDVDCGGSCNTSPSGKCGLSRKCKSAEDCLFKSCVEGVCVEPTCDDGQTNQNETDVDCGGPVTECTKRCGDTKACKISSDCAEGNCINSVCRTPTCADGVKNGTETDKDCGSTCATKCGPGNGCAVNDDCAGKICLNGTCAVPACNDGVQNGTETDKDCGGDCTVKCADALGCSKGADCTSGSCGSNGKCAPISCADGAKNGAETDTDCGGGTCPACKINQVCKASADCELKACVNGKCATPTCSDAQANGSETDVDCGGTCPTKCGLDRACSAGTDCASGSCVNSKCAAPTCSDGVKNGTETDTDCGGNACPKCKTNQKCSTATDCVSSTCSFQSGSNVCACPGGMVVVPRADGGVYCIDATEVTYQQYSTFWNTNQATQGSQPAQCAANTTYTPKQNWPPQPEVLKQPVVHVDWCDAYAYCASSGRHLCGAINGGNVAPASEIDHTKSEWYNACSANGVNLYPYGASPTSGWCNTTGSAKDVPFTIAEKDPVTSATVLKQRCQGGSVGLYDMSASVGEWLDSCAGDDCQIAGGNYQAASTAEISCKSRSTLSRLSADGVTGFRCCL